MQQVLKDATRAVFAAAEGHHEAAGMASGIDCDGLRKQIKILRSRQQHKTANYVRMAAIGGIWTPARIAGTGAPVET
eukprot:15452902-Alexandrium_andersonii.AAC.1